MLVELERDHLRATISLVGAELRSLSLRGIDYLWPAKDPWRRTAPILFPIVGRLRDDRFFHNSRPYKMSQHGFARDKSFQIEQVSRSTATFSLVADQSTLQQYPFQFILEVSYELQSDTLLASYSIRNPGVETLPASLGLHPAFRWPLLPGGDKASYMLGFETDEFSPVRRLKDGLLQRELFPSPIRNQALELSESLFQEDALILLGANSSAIEYHGPRGPSVHMSWTGFHDLGMWSKNPGNFLCIEPWHGFADPENFGGEFIEKPGLMLLEPGETRRFTMQIEPRDRS